MMNRLAIGLGVFFLVAWMSRCVGAETDSEKTARTTADFRSIRNQVETLRGKKFQQEVPVT